MQKRTANFTNIDEYIAQYPEETQALLRTMRATIHAAAPDAVEKISYQMPTFAQHGNLVHFAAMKGYIGFYPTGSGVAAFHQELASYDGTKGAVHFPFDQPLPLELISRIVRFRVKENVARAAEKAVAKTGGRKA